MTECRLDGQEAPKHGIEWAELAGMRSWYPSRPQSYREKITIQEIRNNSELAVDNSSLLFPIQMENLKKIPFLCCG
jgi:hypothetical protein